MWCDYHAISSLFLWHSFNEGMTNSVKGTNMILWTCLGLSLIVSLAVFVLMFLLRKMSSQPLKDEFKNTGWFDSESLKSVSKRWLSWVSVPLLFFHYWLFHSVTALPSMLGDRCAIHRWPCGPGAVFIPVLTLSLQISYNLSLPPGSFLGNYSMEVLRLPWETAIFLTKVSTIITCYAIRNCWPGLLLSRKTYLARSIALFLIQI